MCPRACVRVSRATRAHVCARVMRDGHGGVPTGVYPQLQRMHIDARDAAGLDRRHRESRSHRTLPVLSLQFRTRECSDCRFGLYAATLATPLTHMLRRDIEDGRLQAPMWSAWAHESVLSVMRLCGTNRVAQHSVLQVCFDRPHHRELNINDDRPLQRCESLGLRSGICVVFGIATGGYAGLTDHLSKCNLKPSAGSKHWEIYDFTPSDTYPLPHWIRAESSCLTVLLFADYASY